MSTLIGFDQINLPLGASIIDADLAIYFLGQSVNGGDTNVHLAAIKPDWNPSVATWLLAKSGSNWQTPGAKGASDRTESTFSRVVNYTEVGTWLYFDVTDLLQQGYTSYILYGEYLGVNKAIYFPSNDYWDASKRPQLMIRYDK